MRVCCLFVALFAVLAIVSCQKNEKVSSSRWYREGSRRPAPPHPGTVPYPGDFSPNRPYHFSPPAPQSAPRAQMTLNRLPRTQTELEHFISRFRTHSNTFCDSYVCRHFTRDFCREFLSAPNGGEEAFCEGFVYDCRDSFGNYVRGTEGHEIAIVGLEGDSTAPRSYCLVEPQRSVSEGAVMYCWESSDPISLDFTRLFARILNFPATAQTVIRLHTPDLYQSCRAHYGNFQYFLWDNQWIGESDQPKCCSCSDNTTSTIRVSPPTSFCRGYCATNNAAFVERVSCPGP